MRRELPGGYHLDDDRGRVDVFVLAEHQGRGLGVELVREAVEYPEHRDLPWYLNTRDAHGLYTRFGFEAPSERTMVRFRRGLITKTEDHRVGRRREARGTGPRPPGPTLGGKP